MGMSSAEPETIHLPRAATAGSQARAFIGARFGQHLGTDALQDALVVVAELVNNAVVHGEGRITLKGALRGDTFRVEVTDEGVGSVPEIRQRAADHTGGFGLRVVKSMSRAWGVHPGSTHVWADLPAC
jgi:anti-sigma regulatory factor (Ser/Thr protein kinase)